MGLYKLERYSHEGNLIKVVVMALAGEVAQELSPIRSWSNNNYDLKLGEKARGWELHGWEATSHDTFPFARPAGAQRILFTPAVRSRVHKCTWAYFFSVFWMMHCEKSRSLVCRSVMAVDMVVMHVWMSISWVLKDSLAKAGDPTGEPRRRKPVVSLAGSGGPMISILFGLVD